MGSMLSFLLKPPAALLEDLGTRAKDARLALGWTRKTLATRAGVPEATIKRFETTGRIGTASLIDIAIALDCAEAFESLFAPKPIASIAELETRRRKRGRV